MTDGQSEDLRPTWGQYPPWLKGKCNNGTVALDSAKTRLDTVGAKIRSDIAASPEWIRIIQSYRDIEDQYTARFNFKLFASPELPELVLKPYVSLLNKSFRKNVLLNGNWPQEPSGGWITPENWFGRINDIVRTTIVVKYLDGVEFMAKHIRTIAEQGNCRFEVDYEARDEGYYAAHCYVIFNLEVPKFDWDTERIDIRLEIQITTQLQDVIRKLTHNFYEQKRSRRSPDIKWQWNYSSPEFVPNYLGHILHYVEGMIMEVRMRGTENDASSRRN